MRKFLFILPLILPTSVASQPYSESMAECASLYQNAAQWVRTDDMADRLMKAAIQWADAAVTQADAEGRPTDTDVMWQRIDSRTQAWEAMGQGVFSTENFRDWDSYCKSFARARGIRLTF